MKNEPGVWADKGRRGCCYTSASQPAMCTRMPSGLLNAGSGQEGWVGPESLHLNKPSGEAAAAGLWLPLGVASATPSPLAITC